ncbi:c-type cytochrome [Candidatus Venteria ishoeyi]|uniref:Chlorate reductase subunit gamma n=1 Tax=Candidatus Venteria ishoeyi TaxID=1899563 RepID=A0A1H6FD05_9GAMM|nr:c-type cytochrome [Candidatus Venteria ishoeyi]SEH07271.1 Chlorate reductase subunit gamma precursor [Candidatus Venteria ishoeyi]
MKNFRISAFWQAVLVIAILYLGLSYPALMLPKTLLIQYMIIIIVGVLLFFSFDEARWTEFKSPILAVLRQPNLLIVRWGFLIAIPAIIAYTSYNVLKPSFDAPVELRQVHPAPPSKLKVFNKTYNLTTLENPIRNTVVAQLASDPEMAKNTYQEAISAGTKVYYQNCFYCHGDLMDGVGHFADAFNPRPINFQDVGTIAQLQEAFLFWRITTGGPGLPKEGTPWNSAMPVWHEMLSEDDVWNVITYLYDYVGQVPRMWDAAQSKVVTGMKDELVKKRATMTGKDLYDFRCAVCHGDEGVGDGVAAEFLYPKPRDFSLGLFKYKTSPGALPPRDEDLIKTINEGLQGTGMPGWHTLMSPQQVSSLVPVIKSFDITGTWAPEEAEDEEFDDEGRYTGKNPLIITEREPAEGQVPYAEDSIQKGQQAFKKACAECHGDEGRGNIISGKRLADDWENRIWPRDLTSPWTWRNTNTVSDGLQDEQQRAQIISNIYQRLSIGIIGTPMPAHRAVEEGNKDPVSLEDRWHIANFVYSLRDKAAPPPGETDIIWGTPIAGELPDSPDDALWQQAKAVSLRLAPNIIKDERLFTPLAEAITVRTLYNKNDIVFLLELNDRTDSRPGEKVSVQIQDERFELGADAFALQFPKEGAYETSPMVTKPLYRHGDSAHPTTIWYWNAGSVEPKAKARSMLFDATGPDVKLAPRESAADLKATGKWQHGRWQIVMKRSRTGGKSGDINFEEGRYIPISFANWDGSNGEQGSKHTLTSWYWLLLPPETDVKKVYGIPAAIFLLLFIIGLLVVRSQKIRE